MRRARAVGLAALVGLTALAALAGCNVARNANAPATPPGAASIPRRLFTRVTDAAGIRFNHGDGSSGKKYFPEVMGSGCLMADLDGDGNADIYLLNGASLDGTAPAAGAGGSRYFHNNGDGTFTDRTQAAGLEDGGFAMGVCAGDYNNDGLLDLYVTHIGANRLYRNNGDGTFTDVAKAAEVQAGGFSSSAAFADYDGDGILDLYVSRYVRWDAAHNIPCAMNVDGKTVLTYCRPIVYPALPGILYHGNGDGTFTDVTRQAGVAATGGRGLGCVWLDADGDGKPDLFVANDMSANCLFINQGGGKFKEEALARGVALGENGRPQASMGVAAVDFDGDGLPDLACTNFSGEYLALCRNTGHGYFRDASAETGLIEATSPYVGFGLAFPDIDLDGRPDLFAVNGHVTDSAEKYHPGVTFAQPSLCLLNSGSRFTPATDAGPDVSAARVSRGAAVADFNGDGLPDVLVSNWRGTPDLLRNVTSRHGNWIRLRLQGSRCNRSAIGARVTLRGADSRSQTQWVTSGGSYCSQGDLRLLFGLGAGTEAERVTVRWPGGGESDWAHLAAGKEHLLPQK